MDMKNSLEEPKNNLFKFEKFTNQKIISRPDTPYIDFLANVEINSTSNELNKHFSLFMKQIVDSKNADFLNGKIDVIEFMISKLTNLDIKNVKYLEKIAIRLNHELDLLNQFGNRLPNLLDLRLNGSNIISVSNIGTNFDKLTILQINNCNINDLSGIICFKNLEVLEAAENRIFDLIELEMCRKLKKINLRKNFIKDEDNLFFLGSLTYLKYLNLNENPIQETPGYKKLITENLGFVDKIDQDEVIALSPPKNNANLNYEEIFDLEKIDEIKKNKEKPILKVDSSKISNASLANKNSFLKKIECEKLIIVSKSKINRFIDLQSISPNKKKEGDESENKQKKDLDLFRSTSPNFRQSITNNLNQKSKDNLTKQDATLKNSKDNNTNLPNIKESNNILSKSNSKTNLLKIDDGRRINLLEKNKNPSKEELIQRLENINKDMSQKSQDVTRRLYPARNYEDFEKVALKSMSKIKILHENNQIPGLLKKKKDLNNLVLPKIKDSIKEIKKNETKNNFYKKETSIN